MVYLYYGFYLFLLFLTTSFGIFITVALLSWLILWKSDGMYRVMRTPVAKFKL